MVLVQKEENKILCIARTDDSTGKTEAEAVKKSLDDWQLASYIISMGFDTTSSNTGVHKGACTLLQQMLNRNLLWMACRHHILELVIGSTFKTLFGDTKSPECTLFKDLKKSWDSLDLNSFTLPDIPSSYQKDEEELLEYINSLLSPDNVRNLPRGDYKELLELSKVILGGIIERNKGYVYKIQRPGADHHARWMAKSIYILKMTLLRHQLDLHWQTKRKVEKMSLFVVFVYLKSWFSASCLTSAANNDLELFRRIDKFKSVHKKVSAAAANVLQRHTWYLTEELVPLALFNEKLPLDDRTHLALKIGQLPLEELDIRKPSLPSIHLKSELIEYVGVRSTLPFTLVGVPHTFLLLPDWSTSPHYEKMKTALGDLSPLNDSCERALGLVTTINTKMTRDETSFEELIQVVEAHRKKYSNLTKKDLKKFY